MHVCASQVEAAVEDQGHTRQLQQHADQQSALATAALAHKADGAALQRLQREMQQGTADLRRQVDAVQDQGRQLQAAQDQLQVREGWCV